MTFTSDETNAENKNPSSYCKWPNHKWHTFLAKKITFTIGTNYIVDLNDWKKNNVTIFFARQKIKNIYASEEKQTNNEQFIFGNINNSVYF